MHAYIIHTILLALCYSNMFRPSSGNMNYTFSQPEQQIAVKEQFIDLDVKMYQSYSMNLDL
jgi:hypothetical protein